jgi:hypothetical protein
MITTKGDYFENTIDWRYWFSITHNSGGDVILEAKHLGFSISFPSHFIFHISHLLHSLNHWFFRCRKIQYSLFSLIWGISKIFDILECIWIVVHVMMISRIVCNTWIQTGILFVVTEWRSEMDKRDRRAECETEIRNLSVQSALTGSET